MSLRPPSDNSKTILGVAFCLTVGVSLFFLTRSSIPFAGDNIHSFPHGGSYLDGSKKITYHPPRGDHHFHSFLHKPSNILAFATIFFLILLINVSRLFKTDSGFRCCLCGTAHS
ncbi:triple gene block protein 2 [Kudzu virus D]|nr:triple gene block protein 2 [Kudzu virus D]